MGGSVHQEVNENMNDIKALSSVQGMQSKDIKGKAHQHPGA